MDIFPTSWRAVALPIILTEIVLTSAIGFAFH